MKVLARETLMPLTLKLKNLSSEIIQNIKTESGYFIYQIENTQFKTIGLLALCPVDLYEFGIIQPHESTLPKKVNAIKKQLLTQRAQVQPVMLIHNMNDEIIKFLKDKTQCTEDFFFHLEDGNKHKFWHISDKFREKLANLYAQINNFIVADGHHRLEAYMQLSLEGYITNFMSFLVPNCYSKINAFHRVIGNIDEHRQLSLLNKLSNHFYIQECCIQKRPEYKGEAVCAFSNKSLLLKIKDESLLNENVDMNLCHQLIFQKILGWTTADCERGIEYHSDESILLRENSLSGKTVFYFRKLSLVDVSKLSTLHYRAPHLTYFQPKPTSQIIEWSWEVV